MYFKNIQCDTYIILSYIILLFQSIETRHMKSIRDEYDNFKYQNNTK